MRAVTRLCLLLTVAACFAALPSVALAEPPSNVTPPTFTHDDDAAVGGFLEAASGTWTPTPEYSEFQWLRCVAVNDCDEIGGATGTQYTLDDEDKGFYVAVRETAYNAEDEAGEAVSELFGPVLWAPGIIDNGTIGLGVRGQGSVNVDGGPDSSFGLRLLDGHFESISPGSPAEGWGVADAATNVTGFSNRDQSDENVEITGFTYSPDTATSVVEIDNEGQPYARVTHAFSPSPLSEHLYEIDVTIEPLALAGMTDARYRRNVDWDIEPTPFEEVVTTMVGNSPYLARVSDNGFSNSNPLVELDVVNTPGEVFENGPSDIGAAFDFEFGAIPFGTTRQFKMFYGAAPTRGELLSALADAEVETFSMAHNSYESGFDTGEPAIFALAFADVGGDPLIDAGAPEAVIDSKPSPATSQTTAEFEFSAAAVDPTFECKIDEQPWAACVSPVSYSDLSFDQHKFLVRASSEGLTQTVPTAHAWNVTEHPFDLYFSTSPPWWGPNGDAQFVIGADDADIGDLDLTCSLDGAAPDACDAALLYVGLDDGAHELVVTATDGESTETLSYSWTVSGAVMTRFTSMPNELSSDSEPNFEWQVAGSVDHVECKLDDESWGTCAGTDKYVALANEGEHTFSIRAVDGEGNIQDPVTSHTWTYDGTEPTVTHNLPQILTELPFALEFTASEPLDELGCSIDDGPWKDCLGEVTLSDLDNNQWHSLEYEYEDLAGNGGGGYFEFFVDLGATVATITSAPPEFTTNRAASFAFTAAAGSTFECRLNGNDWEACTSPVNYDLLEWDEHHFFEVRASKNGHTQGAGSWHRWYVGDEPFELYFDESPDRLTTDTSAFFEIDADEYDDDLLTFSCSLDGAAFTPCGEEFEFNGLATGKHKVTVRGSASDVTEEISYEWKIVEDGDTAAFITYGPNQFTSSDDAEFEWSTEGPVDRLECREDGGSWYSCGSGYTSIGDIPTEGVHTFEVVPFDEFDEPGDGDSYTWTIDKTPPVISVGAIPSEVKLPFELPLTANEEISQLNCVIDGVEKGDCGWPLKLTYLSLGQHTIQFYGRDRAGNESSLGSATINVVEQYTPVPAPPAPPATTLPKPTLKKLAKPKKGKLAVKYACVDTSCRVAATVKLGKKKYKLKSVKVKPGSGKVSLKFSKSLNKALKKKKRKKAVATVTITGGGGKSTRSVKF